MSAVWAQNKAGLFLSGPAADPGPAYMARPLRARSPGKPCRFVSKMASKKTHKKGGANFKYYKYIIQLPIF
jgi:hypothetical protein